MDVPGACAKSVGRSLDPEPGDGDGSATRREFFRRIRGGAAALASTAVSFGSVAWGDQNPPDSRNQGGIERVLDSYQNRVNAAQVEAQVPIPTQITNGDEQRYPNFIGNYSKGLPHNTIGEVDPSAYRSLLNAVRQGTAAAFEQVPLGGNTLLVNPVAGVAFDLEGTDSHQLAIPPIPSVASQGLADQAVELYWMALCRDINFLDYGTNPLALAAAAELSQLGSFTGPKFNGGVTPQTLFRGFTVSDVTGPYVAQFMLKAFSYGPYAMTGQISTYLPGPSAYCATRATTMSGRILKGSPLPSSTARRSSSDRDRKELRGNSARSRGTTRAAALGREPPSESRTKPMIFSTSSAFCTAR